MSYEAPRYTVNFIILLLSPSEVQIFSSAPCCQTHLMWKVHVLAKQKNNGLTFVVMYLTKVLYENKATKIKSLNHCVLITKLTHGFRERQNNNCS
jgi:hypothetical protein